MTNNCTNTTQQEVKFGRVAPTIPVSDINRAVQFYSEVLGFKKLFENGDPVGFVILQRDAAELHLSLAKNHKATDRNLAHILVSDAQNLHDQLYGTEHAS